MLKAWLLIWMDRSSLILNKTHMISITQQIEFMMLKQGATNIFLFLALVATVVFYDIHRYIAMQLVGAARNDWPSSAEFEAPLLTTGACANRLELLEKSFDAKRQARKSYSAESTFANARRWSQKNIFDPYEPESTCIYEERFGQAPDLAVRYHAFGDGPNFVCGANLIDSKNSHQRADPSQQRCLVYSFGSKNQIAFEASVHKYLRRCEVHTFEPTLDAPFVGGELSIFHPWGLGEDGVEMKFDGYKFVSKSLSTMMSDLGHTNRTLDIPKIDCEGCEWKAMPKVFNAIAAGKLRVNQILIELHSAKGEPFVTADDVAKKAWHLKSFFELADFARMRIFHKERNAWGRTGYQCVEYSFVSEAFLREVNGLICHG